MHYFLDDLINIKNLDPNNIKIENHTKIFVFATLVM